MGFKEQIDYDPESRVAEEVHVENDGRTILRLAQNVEDILDENKRLLADAPDTRLRKIDQTGMRRVASIPMVVMEKLMREGIMGRGFKIRDSERFKQWLNDPANRFFRTTSERV